MCVDVAINIDGIMCTSKRYYSKCVMQQSSYRKICTFRGWRPSLVNQINRNFPQIFFWKVKQQYSASSPKFEWCSPVLPRFLDLQSHFELSSFRNLLSVRPSQSHEIPAAIFLARPGFSSDSWQRSPFWWLPQSCMHTAFIVRRREATVNKSHLLSGTIFCFEISYSLIWSTVYL